MRTQRRCLLVIVAVCGFLALAALQSTEARADEKLRLECRGPQNFLSEATFVWLDLFAQPIPSTRVELWCESNGRSPTVRVQAPAAVTGFRVSIRVKQGNAGGGNAFERTFTRKLNREQIELELRPGSKAIFKLNR